MLCRNPYAKGKEECKYGGEKHTLKDTLQGYALLSLLDVHTEAAKRGNSLCSKFLISFSLDM